MGRITSQTCIYVQLWVGVGGCDICPFWLQKNKITWKKVAKVHRKINLAQQVIVAENFMAESSSKVQSKVLHSPHTDLYHTELRATNMKIY